MSEKSMQQRNSGRSPGMLAARIAGKVVKEIFLLIGRAVATFIMVGVITGCIVACVMTVYILQYIGADEQIDLDTIKLGYTSIIYAEDPKTGESLELQRLYITDNNRIWVNYEDIPDHTKQALIAIEDKRFMDHDGVDWYRTVGATIGTFIPVEGTTTGGGSTLTQQLIKNITGDDDYRVDRKVREIFRALDVSRRYSRQQILETYFNVVTFGNGTNGIQSAANTYFDKDAKDLTLAESAAIVGITQYPTAYNPFLHPEDNRERQLHVLSEMLDQGRITQKEHDEAVAQELEFKSAKYYETVTATTSYFVDHVIESVIADLMEKYGHTRTRATELLYQEGYSIYTTVDLDIQEHLETVFSDLENFPAVHNAEYPQAACVITDPNGKILAMVGGNREKVGRRTFNRATMATRQPGSALKPLGPYSLSLEYNRIHWSYIVEDGPIKLQEPGKAERLWPVNYYPSYYGNITVQYALQMSTNTVPAKLVQALEPRTVYDFLTYQLEFENLVEQDVALAPMTLGAMTYGVTPLEMAGAYQIFVNGGYFTKPYAYTKVVDSNGRTILEPDTMPTTVLSQDTAVIMNKLLQTVTSQGTGTGARLANSPSGGKTGTSDEDVDQWFVGFSPYYVCQVWMGYDTPKTYNDNGQLVTNSIRYSGLGYPPPKLFKTIMDPLHENLEAKSFIESDGVVSQPYCTISGDMPGPSCPVGNGWYKSSSPRSICTGIHSTATPEESGSSESSSAGTPIGNTTNSGRGPSGDVIDG